MLRAENSIRGKIEEESSDRIIQRGECRGEGEFSTSRLNGNSTSVGAKARGNEGLRRNFPRNRVLLGQTGAIWSTRATFNLTLKIPPLNFYISFDSETELGVS